MAKRTVKINPHAFLKDLRDGLDAPRLIAKYALNQAALNLLLERLMVQGFMNSDELGRRKARLEAHSSREGSSAGGTGPRVYPPTEKDDLGKNQSPEAEKPVRWWTYCCYLISISFSPWSTELERRVGSRIGNSLHRIGIPFLNAANHDAGPHALGNDKSRSKMGVLILNAWKSFVSPVVNAWNHTADRKTLRSEERIFWMGWLLAALVCVGVFLAWEPLERFSKGQIKPFFVLLPPRLIALYFMYRACRFLRQPRWLLIIYGLLLFTLMYFVVPYVCIGMTFGLPEWAQRRRARRRNEINMKAGDGQNSQEASEENAKKGLRKIIARVRDWGKGRSGVGRIDGNL
jgi:hypothetical protein